MSELVESQKYVRTKIKSYEDKIKACGYNGSFTSKYKKFFIFLSNYKKVLPFRKLCFLKSV